MVKRETKFETMYLCGRAWTLMDGSVNGRPIYYLARLACKSTSRPSTNTIKKVKKGKQRIAVNGTPISQLRDVTCHIGSHSVTCHPTQVNAPRLNSSEAGGRPVGLLDLPTPKGWKAELT